MAICDNFIGSTPKEGVGFADLMYCYPDVQLKKKKKRPGGQEGASEVLVIICFFLWIQITRVLFVEIS